MLDQVGTQRYVLPGSWFFPRSDEVSRNLASGRLAPLDVPSAINSTVSVATKEAGLPCLIPAGTRVRLSAAELGSSCSLAGSRYVAAVGSLERYSLRLDNPGRAAVEQQFIAILVRRLFYHDSWSIYAFLRH
jgi:hypothetical protein